MAIEEAVYSRLSTFAGLTALVGAPPNDRIYRVRLPQDVTLPAVRFAKVAVERIGAMGADPGLARARYQFSCWANDPDQARDVAEQIRAALQRWRGTEAGVVIQDSFFETEVDLFEPDVGDPTRGIFHRAIDFEIVHEE